MHKFCISMGFILLAIPTLFSQTVQLNNDIVTMTISLSGGTITELGLTGNNVNPLHSEYGHFLCFDRWGPSSKEDKELGIPFHGEASKTTWTLIQETTSEEGHSFVEMSCLLPIIQLGMNRKIYLNDNTSVFKVVEEITNHNDGPKVFNLVQHPTIGAPFLDENTVVDTEADSGFSQSGTLPPTPGDVITWPEDIVDGDLTDLRYLKTDHSWNSSVVSFVLDQTEEHRWVTIVNPSLNLMLGYIWPASEFPWLNMWLRLKDGAPFARGLEFGTTGLHKTWPEILETEQIFGKRLYEEIGVNDTVIKTYYTFMTQVPSDYEGVEAVSMNNNKIRIEPYGLDSSKTIELSLLSLDTGIESFASKQTSDFSLDQNFPNPFNNQTTIGYEIRSSGKVKLEVFNALGQNIATLVDAVQKAGSYRGYFDASGLPGGIYLYRLSFGNHHSQKIMVINR